MRFDQAGQAQAAGQRQQLFEAPLFQYGDDKEEGVRAVSGGLKHLVFVEDEVLAQEGYFDGFPDHRQVVEAAQEVFLLGQHGDGGGACGGVGLRQLHRVESPAAAARVTARLS